MSGIIISLSLPNVEKRHLRKQLLEGNN